MRKKENFEAYLDDYGLIHAYISLNFYQGNSKKFYLKNGLGALTECIIQTIEHRSHYLKYTLSIKPELITIGKKYTLLEEHGLGCVLQFGLIVRTNRFNDEFCNFREDYGAHVIDNQTHFVLWAPTAYEVVLKLFKPSGIQYLTMQRKDKGVYEAWVSENCHGYLYSYIVSVNGKTNVVNDPYGYSSDANGRHSCVVDFQQIHIDFNDHLLPPFQSKTDATILEVSVRDFSIDRETNIVHKGQFLGLIEENRIDFRGNAVGFDYLKQLKPTHVQLMPVFDFATVDEENPRLFYNWGYDPAQYNTLEGSYSTNPHDPLSRVKEFAQVISFYHKHGIRITLDVVYNHMYDLESSHFERIVPYYYFRYGMHGQISNGSFCGNDVDSSNGMVRHFILLSVLHFVKHYHIDGLRFDLMGILDIDTMNLLVKRCQVLNPDFMIYGEGWNMPTLLDEKYRASMVNAWQMPEVGFFNDFYRDHVKGPTASDRAWAKGYTLGDAYFVEAFMASVVANSVDGYCVKLFDSPTQSVNYIECHDNLTLWDKIKEACKEDSKEQRIAKQKLTIGAQCVSQGVLFLQFGQEACRSKNGVDNSYRSNDEINKISYARTSQYQSVVNYTKDLIDFRQQHKVFRCQTAQEIQERISFKMLANGCCMMRCEDEHETLLVFFNPSKEQYFYELDQEGILLIDENGYTNKPIIHTVSLNPISMIVVSI